ncbi:uncharacterized protein [Embiotoca jacksoni]|uniref:uncharacterized protein isoform X1 n=1 Tax=Embiotoca jacksoni TaxID=100190 RepID=UPI0037041556
MAHCSLLMVLMVVATATGARADSEENELDYGYWNYREGADSVNVASVRSVTRVLDTWGKRIFSEIKTLLHSQPSTLLPDYSSLFQVRCLLHLHVLTVGTGAPSVRVRQRPLQGSLSAAPPHHRALSSPSNAGTVPPSPWLPGGGGRRRWHESGGGESGPVHPKDRGEGEPSEGEPGGEEETGESPQERGSEAGSVTDRQMNRGERRRTRLWLCEVCQILENE